jgi:hypothetical protein
MPHLHNMAQQDSICSNPFMETRQIQYKACSTAPTLTWVIYFLFFQRLGLRSLSSGWFSKTIGYGVVYGHTDIISSLETSYILIAALIAGDTPQQITWHLDGAQRAGATLDEIRAVRELSIEVAKFSGVQWRHSVPQVEVFQA